MSSGLFSASFSWLCRPLLHFQTVLSMRAKRPIAAEGPWHPHWCVSCRKECVLLFSVIHINSEKNPSWPCLGHVPTLEFSSGPKRMCYSGSPACYQLTPVSGKGVQRQVGVGVGRISQWFIRALSVLCCANKMLSSHSIFSDFGR